MAERPYQFRLRTLLVATAVVGVLLGLFVLWQRGMEFEAAYGMVTGEVVVDGEPLTAGTVAFHQPDGRFVGGVVETGRFSIDRVPVGRSFVTIQGRTVPGRYSTPGDLEVWIVSDVGNVCDLHLGGDDRGVPLPEDDPLLQAIEKRFGEPDYVRVNDRFRIVYRLSNGDTLTLVVHDDKVIGIEHQLLFD